MILNCMVWLVFIIIMFFIIIKDGTCGFRELYTNACFCNQCRTGPGAGVEGNPPWPLKYSSGPPEVSCLCSGAVSNAEIST